MVDKRGLKMGNSKVVNSNETKHYGHAMRVINLLKSNPNKIFTKTEIAINTCVALKHIDRTITFLNSTKIIEKINLQSQTYYKLNKFWVISQ